LPFVLSQLHPAALCEVDQPLDGNHRGSSSSSGAQVSAVRVYGVEYELHALQSVYQPACSSNGSLSVYSNSTSGRKAVPSATGKEAASGAATSGNDSNVTNTAEGSHVSSGSAPATASAAVTAVATTGSKEKDKEAKQLGSTGSLSWTGDLPELRGSLRGFGNQIKLLEEEHRKKVQLVHQF
jgi:hypothetical protein